VNSAGYRPLQAAQCRACTPCARCATCSWLHVDCCNTLQLAACLSTLYMATPASPHVYLSLCKAAQLGQAACLSGSLALTDSCRMHVRWSAPVVRQPAGELPPVKPATFIGTQLVAQSIL
jgi:hypothetical protein